MTDVEHRWFRCVDCGGLMLSVGGVTGHWYRSEGRRCRQPASGDWRMGRLDPWQVRRGAH